MTQEEIGLKFSIKKNMVCDILKDKEKWLNIELTGSNTTKQKQKSDKEREKLQELISNYDIENVFNCDKTGNNFIELINVIYFILTKVLFNLGLYWELEPSKTLSTSPLSGMKKSKNRVTILLTFN